MMENLHEIIRLIENRWSEVRALVIGDVMLDRYIWGDVERISPEAPVPIVRASHISAQPGGAANVAMNIVGLGAKAVLVGFCGDDAEREVLLNKLSDAGISADLIVVSTHPTTTKLRIIGGKQQMLRLDTENADEYSQNAYSDLIQRIEAAISISNVVVLSDYGKGVLSEEVCQAAIGLARSMNVPVLVDPKQKEFSRYRGATTICPNLTELSVATGVSSSDLDQLFHAAQKMTSQLALDYMTATLSEKGIAILAEDQVFVAPAVARQVFDVSGAGDTVIATLALSAAGRLDRESAVQLANIAAGIVVSKVGTVPVKRSELLTSLNHEIELQAKEKVLSAESLALRVTAWRSAGQSIVFTNGCFDLLHIGHITLLEDAHREGDRLVVGINSDASVRILKGSSRPIVGERERARILAALSAVDAVVIFDEPTPLNLITALQPDVIVKGGDYSESTVVGAKEVLSWGGRVKIVPIVAGYSTTNLISKASVNTEVKMTI